MHHLHWRKITLAWALLFSLSAVSQHAVELNLPDHDNKRYYFGISLGYNRSNYNISHDSSFINNNLITGIESINTGRVHLGILANYQLSKRFDLRFSPLNLVFSDKIIKFYKRNEPETEETTPSITMTFPLQVRLKSDRINNMRVYTLMGGKYEFDLASNAKSTSDVLKIKRNDYGIEGGVGFQFFFPYFILSPEIKISYGLSNVHARDPEVSFSKLMNIMNSRLIMFTLHFEGGGLGK